MTQVLQFISHFRQSLLLYVYMAVSFLLIISSDSAIVGGIRAMSMNTFGTAQEVFDDMAAYFDLREKNSELRRENTRLAYEIYQLQDALLENIRLRKMLQFKYDVEYELIPAKVVGYSPQNLLSGVMLSTEEMGKVKKFSAVMTAEGLVGKVVEISGDYAICQILLDPNNRVSGQILRNSELGLVRGDGSRILYMDHLPNTVDVLEGDVVLTSGYSQIYPQNIKIGVVSEVRKSEEALFQTVKIRPAVNFNRLEEVFIYSEKVANEQ